MSVASQPLPLARGASRRLGFPALLLLGEQQPSECLLRNAGTGRGELPAGLPTESAIEQADSQQFADSAQLHEQPSPDVPVTTRHPQPLLPKPVAVSQVVHDEPR